MNLDRVGADALGHLAGKQLGHGSLCQAGHAGVLEARGVMDQLASRLDLRRHLRELELYRLMLEDRFAEGLAFFRVAQRGLEGSPRHTHTLRSDADAATFKARECDLVAGARLADHQTRRDAAVLEQDLRRVARVLAELVLYAGDRIARRFRGHDERADAALAGSLVSHGHHDCHFGVLARGDELLDAVQHIVVAVKRRGRAQAGRVGADVRLSQTERAKHLAARERHQPLLLLRLAREAHHDRADGAVVDRHHRAGAAIASGDFLKDDRQRRVVEPGTAVLVGHGDAVAAELGQALEFRRRKFV